MANTSLGEKIRHHRLLKGLSRDDMATKLKITHGAYSKIERNETDPNHSRLEQIAKILGISVIDILSTFSKTKPKNELEKVIAEKDKQIMKLIGLLGKKR